MLPMKGFRSYLTRRQERRKELHDALRAIDSNQSTLGDTNTKALRRIVVSRHVSEEMRDMVERHLGPDAISSTLGLNPRSRR